jgi:hypothetical protein
VYFLVVLVCVLVYHAGGDEELICTSVVSKSVLAGVQGVGFRKSARCAWLYDRFYEFVGGFE